jgi:hypothetical protein
MITELRKRFQERLQKIPLTYGAMEYGSATIDEKKARDYDLMVVADCNLLIPGELYEDLALVVSDIFTEFKFPMDIVIIDKQIPETMLSTFGPTYRNHFHKYGKRLVGKDVRPLFTKSFVDYAHDLSTLQFEALGYLCWSLANRRCDAIWMVYRRDNDPDAFYKAIDKGLDLENFCSSIAIFEGKGTEKFEGLQAFSQAYPEFAKELSLIQKQSENLDEQSDDHNIYIM